MTDIREEVQEWRNFAGYMLKIARVHLWNLTQWVNRYTLKTCLGCGEARGN